MIIHYIRHEGDIKPNMLKLYNILIIYFWFISDIFFQFSDHRL